MALSELQQAIIGCVAGFVVLLVRQVSGVICAAGSPDIQTNDPARWPGKISSISWDPHLEVMHCMPLDVSRAAYFSNLPLLLHQVSHDLEMTSSVENFRSGQVVKMICQQLVTIQFFTHVDEIQ